MLFAILFSIGWVILDQLSKLWAVQTLQIGRALPVFGRVLQFQYLENRGAAFGILQGNILFFTVLTIGAVGLLLYMLYRYHHLTRWYSLALALIIGGAIGNLIDRMRLGYVIDFIRVDLVSFFDFPIFNVADIGVTVGVCLLALLLIVLPESVWEKK